MTDKNPSADVAPSRVSSALHGPLLGVTAFQFKVLTALGDLGGERRAAHIAQALGEPLEQVERALISLSYDGLVHRARDGRFSLGQAGEIALA